MFALLFGSCFFFFWFFLTPRFFWALLFFSFFFFYLHFFFLAFFFFFSVYSLVSFLPLHPSFSLFLYFAPTYFSSGRYLGISCMTWRGLAFDFCAVARWE